MVTTAAKVVVGRKNMPRALEAFRHGLSGVSFVWLFVVLPFDFSHLADVLPNFLRFLWISNNVAKVLMTIGIIIYRIIYHIIYPFSQGTRGEKLIELSAV